MRRFFAVVLLLNLGAGMPLRAAREPGLPSESPDATKALAKIAGEALVESHAYQFLTELSDDIGARVTG